MPSSCADNCIVDMARETLKKKTVRLESENACLREENDRLQREKEIQQNTILAASRMIDEYKHKNMRLTAELAEAREVLRESREANSIKLRHERAFDAAIAKGGEGEDV